jgi:hypothetical protein
MRRAIGVGIFLLSQVLFAQTPDAAEIMRRVSENLDRAEAARGLGLRPECICPPAAGEWKTGS